MDVWREENQLKAWIKTPHKDFVHTIPYTTWLYAKPTKNLLNILDRPYWFVTQKSYDGTSLRLIKIPVGLQEYERFVHSLEKATKHRVHLYNADIKPEQQFLYANHLYPGCSVNIQDNILGAAKGKERPALTQLYLEVHCSDIRNKDAKIHSLTIQEKTLRGEERALRELARTLKDQDPDIIYCKNAFAAIPLISQKAAAYGIELPLHRFANHTLRYKGGKSFYSYGQVTFRDFAVRLRGRFLVDAKSVVGQECDAEAILEMCKLSGTPFQTVASRSHGSVFQGALVRLLYQDGVVISHKQKPLMKPVSMHDLVKLDRAGIALDPQIGFHTDVAEIDFVSMFPHIMRDRNISAEKINTHNATLKAPNTPVWIDMQGAGYISQAMRPFIDLRLHYKKNPSELNKKRAAGLKGVLVSANGYLRFREFKLGLPTTHSALCAYARKALIDTKKLAEDGGYRVLHGIIDSIYVQRKDITQEEVKRLANEAEHKTTIPAAVEGIFKWIVFLPSVNDPHRPVVTRYYGALRAGGIKVRGVEARQKSQPPLIRKLQEAAINHMAQYDTKQDVIAAIPAIFSMARKALELIDTLPAATLAYKVRITKQEYKHNIAQKKILSLLKKKGITPLPGQTIRYCIDAHKGYVLPENLSAPDIDAYKNALVRALYSTLCVFEYTRKDIDMCLCSTRQETLEKYMPQNVHSLLTGLVYAQEN